MLSILFIILWPMIATVPVQVLPDKDSTVVVYSDSLCTRIEKRYSPSELCGTRVFVSFDKFGENYAGNRIREYVDGKLQPEYQGWVKKEYCNYTVKGKEDFFLFSNPCISSAKRRFRTNRSLDLNVISIIDSWMQVALDYGRTYYGWIPLNDSGIRACLPFDDMDYDFILKIFSHIDGRYQKQIDLNSVFSHNIEDLIKILGDDYSTNGVLASPTHNPFLKRCLSGNEYYSPDQYAIKFFKWSTDSGNITAICMPQSGELYLPGSLLKNENNYDGAGSFRIKTEDWIAGESGTELWKVFCITDDETKFFTDELFSDIWSSPQADPGPHYDGLYKIYLSEKFPVICNGNVVFDDISRYLEKTPQDITGHFGQAECVKLNRNSFTLPDVPWSSGWNIEETDPILEYHYRGKHNELLIVYFKQNSLLWRSFHMELNNYDALPLIE